jgi:hypothetical protein
MTIEAKNVDDLIVQDMNPSLVPQPVVMTNNEPEVAEELEIHEEPKHEEPIVAEEPKTEVARETTDDYGNPIATKERVYTQSEVENMIRERLSRGQYAQQPQQPPQPAYQPEPQTPNPEDWEAQLDQYIDQRLAKRQHQEEQQRWQRQEQETQAQFEIRFNQGMSKYQDFEQVVMGKPLTPQMVIATRGMQDPAAFIYAAAKTQAPELERIARIQDPISQVVELGRLEERMRKSRNATSQAPKPIDIIRGDAVEPAPKKWSVDEKLRHAEEQLRKEKMRGRNT